MSGIGDAGKGPQTLGMDYEQEYVHDVYEQIASHFSSTRYKPWPIIERFLSNLVNGSVGLDIGCGNGKYLMPTDSADGSSKRSQNLVSIASRHHPHSVVMADILDLPHAVRTFDFAISIAVIHHLSTPERRREAIRSILETVKPRGQVLLYVWALEQEHSRRGWTETDNQDVMVPWVMRGSKKAEKEVGQAATQDQTFHRYYHLYRKGELESDVLAAGGEVTEAGYEKDNWWVIATSSPRAIDV